MPTYDYECRDCSHKLEQFQNMKDDALVTCPKCHADSLFRVITGGNGFFLSNRTIGVIADKNESSFSAEYKKVLNDKTRRKQDVLSPHLQDGAEIVPQKTEEKPAPQWYDQNRTVSDDKLRKATPEQQKKYIETGKL